MSENGGRINQEPAIAVPRAPAEQEPRRGIVKKVLNILNLGGAVINETKKVANEAQNAPQRLNPTSTAEPTPIEPQPQKT
ncbi:MAG: hypothetical protein AAB531_02670 [Patescibacteria group bacterium]